ncbi:unnamed protein product [Periconia digitata]|uniref:Uncharacterized protein n=1 Tax=Periconia digitata TaxID=1303443 RepID=A0A9W4USV4_9PLEO|nr:unnamed protein product [Periconia digitata]
MKVGTLALLLASSLTVFSNPLVSPGTRRDGLLQLDERTVSEAGSVKFWNPVQGDLVEIEKREPLGGKKKKKGKTTAKSTKTTAKTTKKTTKPAKTTAKSTKAPTTLAKSTAKSTKTSGKSTKTTAASSKLSTKASITSSKTSVSSATGTAAQASACKKNSNSKSSKSGKTLESRRKAPTPEQIQDMYDNYEKAKKVAKGKALEMGKAYVFLLSQGVHHTVIIGEIKMIDCQPAMEATAQQLVKANGGASSGVERHALASFFCGSSSGGVCDTDGVEYVPCAKWNGNYKLKGEADLQYANPEHFIQKGDQLLAKEKPYNLFTNNCRTFAKTLVNVTKKKDDEPVEL